ACSGSETSSSSTGSSSGGGGASPSAGGSGTGGEACPEQLPPKNEGCHVDASLIGSYPEDPCAPRARCEGQAPDIPPSWKHIGSGPGGACGDVAEACFFSDGEAVVHGETEVGTAVCTEEGWAIAAATFRIHLPLHVPQSRPRTETRPRRTEP